MKLIGKGSKKALFAQGIYSTENRCKFDMDLTYSSDTLCLESSPGRNMSMRIDFQVLMHNFSKNTAVVACVLLSASMEKSSKVWHFNFISGGKVDREE